MAVVFQLVQLPHFHQSLHHRFQCLSFALERQQSSQIASLRCCEVGQVGIAAVEHVEEDIEVDIGSTAFHSVQPLKILISNEIDIAVALDFPRPQFVLFLDEVCHLFALPDVAGVYLGADVDLSLFLEDDLLLLMEGDFLSEELLLLLDGCQHFQVFYLLRPGLLLQTVVGFASRHQREGFYFVGFDSG